MINYNSPIIQAMISQTPPGQGNMPMLPGVYGNPPTVQTMVEPVYQAPPYVPGGEVMFKEQFQDYSMHLQQQQMMYQPPIQMPYQSMAGPYGYPKQYYQSPYTATVQNPAKVNSIFSEYQNPYLTQNIYAANGIPANQINNPDVIIRMEQARFNEVSYQQQLQIESSVMKRISHNVNKSLGIELEPGVEEKLYGVDAISGVIKPKSAYDLLAHGQEEPEKKGLVVSVVLDGEVVVPPTESKIDYSRNEVVIQMQAAAFDYYTRIDCPRAQAIVNRQEYIKSRVPDSCDIAEYLNKYAAIMESILIQEEWMASGIKNVAQIYNKAQFRELIEKNKPKIFIDGREVSRGYSTTYLTPQFDIIKTGGVIHPVMTGYGDPEVLTNLKIDPMTGKPEPNMPAFMKNRIQMQAEMAKMKFKAAVDQQVMRAGMYGNS